jgi:hypothetical protein
LEIQNFKFLIFTAFCSPREKQEIHFVDFQDMVLCHAEQQGAKFRFRGLEFPAIGEKQNLELASCHKQLDKTG